MDPPRVFREPSRAEIFGMQPRARALRADDPPRTWPHGETMTLWLVVFLIFVSESRRLDLDVT